MGGSRRRHPTVQYPRPQFVAPREIPIGNHHDGSLFFLLSRGAAVRIHNTLPLHGSKEALLLLQQLLLARAL